MGRALLIMVLGDPAALKRKVTRCTRAGGHSSRSSACRSPKFHPFGSLKSLCGAATWRPPGGITLTFNHHLEGHRLVLSPGTTTTSRFSRLHHLPVPAACGRVGAEPENQAYHQNCLDSMENSDSVESAQISPSQQPPRQLSGPRSQDLPCLAWPPAEERSRRRGTCPS